MVRQARRGAETARGDAGCGWSADAGGGAPRRRSPASGLRRARGREGGEAANRRARRAARPPREAPCGCGEGGARPAGADRTSQRSLATIRDEGIGDQCRRERARGEASERCNRRAGCGFGLGRDTGTEDRPRSGIGSSCDPVGPTRDAAEGDRHTDRCLGCEGRTAVDEGTDPHHGVAAGRQFDGRPLQEGARNPRAGGYDPGRGGGDVETDRQPFGEGSRARRRSPIPRAITERGGFATRTDRGGPARQLRRPRRVGPRGEDPRARREDRGAREKPRYAPRNLAGQGGRHRIGPPGTRREDGEAHVGGPTSAAMEEWKKDVENRVKIIQKKAMELLDREEKMRKKEEELRALAQQLGVKL